MKAWRGMGIWRRTQIWQDMVRHQPSRLWWSRVKARSDPALSPLWRDVSYRKWNWYTETQWGNHIWRLDTGSYTEVVPWHNDTSQNSREQPIAIVFHRRGRFSNGNKRTTTMKPRKKWRGEGVNSYPILISSNIPFQNQNHPWFSLVILTPFSVANWTPSSQYMDNGRKRVLGVFRLLLRGMVRETRHKGCVSVCVHVGGS